MHIYIYIYTYIYIYIYICYICIYILYIYTYILFQDKSKANVALLQTHLKMATNGDVNSDTVPSVPLHAVGTWNRQPVWRVTRYALCLDSGQDVPISHQCRRYVTKYAGMHIICSPKAGLLTRKLANIVTQYIVFACASSRCRNVWLTVSSAVPVQIYVTETSI